MTQIVKGVRVQVVYLHGMDSSPQGFKARFLRERYPNLIAPALSNDVLERLAVAKSMVPTGCLLVGSSLGAVTALDLLRHDPNRAGALVLLAPAVGLSGNPPRREQYLEYVSQLRIPPHVPTVVIAAIHDETVPLAAVRSLVAHAGPDAAVSLVEIDDTHVLHTKAAQTALAQAVAMLSRDPSCA